jgi:uncharacterized protein
MSRWLFRIALFSERHYRPILAGALLICLLCGFLIQRIRFDPDVLGLLPREDPAVATFRATLESFGGLDLLLVVVRVPEGAVIDPYQEFVDVLAQEIEGLPEIDYVDYRIGEPSQLLRAFFPRALFFLKADERQQVLEALSSTGIDTRVAELRRRLSTPQSLAVKDLLLIDPLAFSEIFLRRLEAGRGSLGVDWSSGYYLSKDKRLFLLLAKPKGAAQDIPFDRRLAAAVDGAIARAGSTWQAQRSEQGEEPSTPPKVALGGSYITALADAEMIQRDVIVNASSSVLIVLLLFLFAFRRMGLLLYALLPLGWGMLVTFGLFALTGQVLSSAASGCAALLVGLAIDFVIVSYGRYVEERQKGSDGQEALRAMTGSCGRAVVIGAVTTAATFFAFSVTKFDGLRQMGLLTGTGILFCMLGVLLILPALLAWSEARHMKRSSSPKLFVHGFGAGELVRLSIRRPQAVLVAGAIVTALCLVAMTKLRFESSIANLRPEGNRGVEVQSEVSRHFGTNFRYMMMVAKSDSLDRTLDLAAAAAEGAEPMVRSGDLQRVDSIASIMPAPTRQREVLEWLAKERQGRLALDRIRADFAAALAVQGLRPEPFAEGIGLLSQALGRVEPISLDEVRGIEGADRLIDRYLHHSDGAYKSVVYLYPEGDRFKREPPPAAEALARELGPEVELTGVNVLSRSLRRQVWFDAILAGVLGAVLVLLLLWLDYRALRPTLLSMAPLGFGMIWMLGVMAMFGLDINFMNIFVTTMIIGIGVDYGVHMLHRYRDIAGEGEEGIAAGLVETGQSVAMAALTTIAGFGSLALSHYPGLRSIGYAAGLGAGLTAFSTLTIVPAFLILMRRRRAARGQAAS